MRFLLVATAAMCVGLLPLAGAPALDQKPKSDLDRLQGTWVYMSQTIGGWELPKERRDPIWIEIEKDFFIRTGQGGGGLVYKLTLDPTTTPKSFDLVSHQHPSGKTFVSKGIYELDSDTLKLCYDNTGKERPTQFGSPEGQDNIVLSILQRKKP